MPDVLSGKFSDKDRPTGAQHLVICQTIKHQAIRMADACTGLIATKNTPFADPEYLQPPVA